MEEVELIAHGPEPMKLDGLRFSGAGWWVLVRPSRTEPIIRVMAEGTDERQVRELVEDYTSVVRQACGRLGREVRR
jgi:phosphomannomutase